METKSVRLPEELNTFISESDYNFAEDVRTTVQNAAITHAVGKCAITGDIVYTGNFATVGTTTPLGNALDAPSEVKTIDLREDIFSELSEMLVQEGSIDSHKHNTLTYLNEIGPVLYTAETKAISDATPEKSWKLIATHEPTDDLDRRVEDMLLWSYDASPPEHLRFENIWDHSPEYVKQRIRQYTENHADPTVESHYNLIQLVESLTNKD